MSKMRDEWNRVLALELERWNAKPWRQVKQDLGDGNIVYEVVVDSKTYQVEADLLEDTEAYLQIGLAVDDGAFPWAMIPAGGTLIVRKDPGATA